jgi:hypothetical protein
MDIWHNIFNGGDKDKEDDKDKDNKDKAPVDTVEPTQDPPKDQEKVSGKDDSMDGTKTYGKESIEPNKDPALVLLETSMHYASDDSSVDDEDVATGNFDSDAVDNNGTKNRTQLLGEKLQLIEEKPNTVDDKTDEDAAPSRCYGWYLPLAFGIIALGLGSFQGLAFCDTLTIKQVEGNNDLVLMVGVLSYRTTSITNWSSEVDVPIEFLCTNYNNMVDTWNGSDYYDVDDDARMVLVLMILAPLLGLFNCFTVLCAAKCPGIWGLGKKGSWKRTGASFLVTSIFQGVTLLIKESSICYDNPVIQRLRANSRTMELANTFGDCEVAVGYVLQSVAVALYALAGWVILFWIDEPTVTAIQRTRSAPA